MNTRQTTTLEDFIFNKEAHTFEEFEDNMLFQDDEVSIDSVEFIRQPL